MASLPKSLATASQITQQVGAMMPLGQISSVVQTLQNIQGFNPGAFSQLSGTIQSALTGINQATSIVQNFASGSPVEAFTNTLSAVGLAGSSVSQLAQAAGAAYQQADSFLSSTAQAQSWQKLNSQRPSVEASRESNRELGRQNLVFPLDIGKYWISLMFEKVNFNTVMGSQKAYYQRKPTGSIILPVPINLVDTNKLQYKPISLTAETVGSALTAAGVSLPGVLGRIGRGLIQGGSAVSGAVDAASSVTGLTVNTHQTLKFEQPTLKDHTFTWKLVPSSAEEARVLYKIIETIKGRIYPRKNDLVFAYPDLVNVALFNGQQLFLFKPAYVQGFSVNYTTEGGPSFHKDGHPTSVQIDMHITENAVWTADDFGWSEVTTGEALSLVSLAGGGIVSGIAQAGSDIISGIAGR